MSSVGGVGGTGQTQKVVNEAALDDAVKELCGALPEADRSVFTALVGGLLGEKPVLVGPLTASGLSLDVLVEAVGGEERKTTVKTSTEALKAKAAQSKAANDKALDEIKTRLDKLAKEEALSPFMKAFKYIGMALGAIASIATIAVGALTANPLMVVAGSLMLGLVIDSIVSEATGGKYSISAGVSAIAQKCGASEETAKWIALGATVLLTVATIALSFGAAAAASGTQLATTVMNVLVKAQQVSSIASGVVAVGSGACQVAQTVLEYQVEQSKARSKDIQAILERIKESVEVEEDFLKFIVEKFSSLLSSVGDIVKQSAEAQMEVLAGQSPPLA